MSYKSLYSLSFNKAHKPGEMIHFCIRAFNEPKAANHKIKTSYSLSFIHEKFKSSLFSAIFFFNFGQKE